MKFPQLTHMTKSQQANQVALGIYMQTVVGYAKPIAAERPCLQGFIRLFSRSVSIEAISPLVGPSDDVSLSIRFSIYMRIALFTF